MNDYYKEYEGEFEKEIEEACNCIEEHQCDKLYGDICNIKSKVENLNLSSIWPDGVGENFLSVVDTTKGCLNEISNSIASLFVESEGIYKKIKEQLSFLKTANTKYMNKRDNEMPIKDDYRVSSVYENGKLIKEGYFNQSAYERDRLDWEREVKNLIEECETLQEEIEKNKERLSEIDSSTVMSGSNFSTLEMKYGDTLSSTSNPILELA